MHTFTPNTIADANKINDNFDEVPTLLDVYPVGAVYISVDSTNPSTLFGGTWSAFGAGRVLVGIDSSDTDFDTAEETRGAKTVAGANHRHYHQHTHNHDHRIGIALEGGGLFWRAVDPFGTSGSFTPTDYANTGTPSGTSAYSLTDDDATGASLTYTNYTTPSATSVVQPSIVVYMWKRTA